MSGSATPFGAGERLRLVSEGIPTRSLNVPNGITHVWALSQYGPASVVLWTDDGWTLVPLPRTHNQDRSLISESQLPSC